MKTLFTLAALLYALRLRYVIQAKFEIE